MDSVKENYLAVERFTFLPQIAVRSLPKDSGPIDFAYDIHIPRGEKATLVPRSIRMVSLIQPRKTQGIRLIISPTRTPLDLAVTGSIFKTSKARNKIRLFFLKTKKELSFNKGLVRL